MKCKKRRKKKKRRSKAVAEIVEDPFYDSWEGRILCQGHVDRVAFAASDDAALFDVEAKNVLYWWGRESTAMDCGVCPAEKRENCQDTWCWFVTPTQVRGYPEPVSVAGV